jgi:hypothetical protein
MKRKSKNIRKGKKYGIKIKVLTLTSNKEEDNISCFLVAHG